MNRQHPADWTHEDRDIMARLRSKMLVRTLIANSFDATKAWADARAVKRHNRTLADQYRIDINGAIYRGIDSEHYSVY
jgi:hypothetical protein